MQPYVAIFFLGFGETFLGTYKLTEIKDLKNCSNQGGGQKNFIFRGMGGSLHHKFSLILHRIAAWDNVTSSIAESSKNIFLTQIGFEMIFSVLMLLGIQSNLLVFTLKLPILNMMVDIFVPPVMYLIHHTYHEVLFYHFWGIESVCLFLQIFRHPGWMY